MGIELQSWPAAAVSRDHMYRWSESARRSDSVLDTYHIKTPIISAAAALSEASKVDRPPSVSTSDKVGGSMEDSW
jgi:hypothetical protein